MRGTKEITSREEGKGERGKEEKRRSREGERGVEREEWGNQ